MRVLTSRVPTEQVDQLRVHFLVRQISGGKYADAAEDYILLARLFLTWYVAL